MAPPIPGLARPPARRSRSAGDVLAAIAAVVALAGLTVGVPAALVSFFGLPIPHSAPSLSLLTHQLDLLTILKILSVVVWLAWIQLVCCVAVEVAAAVRGHAVASQVPLAGGTQALIHRLVAAALLLFTAAAVLSPSLLHLGPSTSAATARPPAATAPAAAGQMPRYGLDVEHAGFVNAGRHAPEKYYIVKPPVGRYHESLWEIAENHLGNGRRYREIYELNQDRVQPDGTKLTIASLIRPGWVLQMPADAYGPGIHYAPGARAEGPVARYLDHGHEHRGAGEDALTRPAAVPATARGAGHDQRPAGHSATPRVAPAAPAGDGPMRDLAAASLLAAGLLAALGRRRREQLWRRAFGSRVPGPEGAAAEAEVALRLGASEPAVRALDASLRGLAADLATAGRTLPTVFLARLSDSQLALWIAPADPSPPPPWSAVSDGQTWQLSLAPSHALDRGHTAGVLAPFPGLVCVGTDSGGRVLVDLEAAYGLIAICGPAGRVQEALAAIAAELATNQWSDRMELILVGFGAELTLLAPDRVTATASLAEALPLLENRAERVSGALAATGLDSVLTGRARGVEPSAFAPCYLISAVPPDEDERARLLALARSRHENAAGYVVAGEVPGATWTWQLTDDGRLTADLLGVDVAAQLLPAAQYSAVIELFRSACEPALVPLGPPDPGGSAGQLASGSPVTVEVQILGQVLVRARGGIEPERVGLATEIVTYLATHPGGVNLNVLTGAIWPRGVTPEVRGAALARVADWLGTDSFGRSCLVSDEDDRLRLGPQARLDWDVFSALVAEAGQADGDEAEYLATALDLVHGQLLDGRGPGRYAWLAADDLEYEVTARVADAAHRLCELRLAARNPAGAMAACRAGLRLACSDELLWRDLLTAAHATGDEQLLRSVVDEVSARAALDEVLPRLAPQTEALIDEILPAWRTSVA
jgi:hypothetical protein